MPKPHAVPTPTLTRHVNGVPCVTVAEAAKLRKCSRQAIWIRVQRGTLPSFRIADRIYIPIKALQDE